MCINIREYNLFVFESVNFTFNCFPYLEIEDFNPIVQERLFDDLLDRDAQKGLKHCFIFLNIFISFYLIV